MSNSTDRNWDEIAALVIRSMTYKVLHADESFVLVAISTADQNAFAFADDWETKPP